MKKLLSKNRKIAIKKKEKGVNQIGNKIRKN